MNNEMHLNRREVLGMLALLGAGASVAGPAFGETGSAVDNASVKVVFENEKMRVVEHRGRPRMGVCGTGLHSHPPHLTIALTDVKARVTLPGKEPFIAENKAGDVFWDPGGAHVVENIGSSDSRVYLVEPKPA